MEVLYERHDTKEDQFSDNKTNNPSASAFTSVKPTTRSYPPSCPSVWYSSLLTSLYNSRYREHNNNTEEDDHNNNDKKEDTKRGEQIW